ncbi:MAG: glycosyltransferase [Candidatus Hydrogenedens sp.]|nr:glycosyltransferase [Candidatus Hydrogenedens sp.]
MAEGPRYGRLSVPAPEWYTKRMHGADTPHISIGIPTRDGGVLLKRLLQAVFAQESRWRYEVYALDSGSTDGTLRLLEKFPVRVVPVAQDTFNWGRLRERLFEEARAPVVVNLSQDAVPARTDWLDNLVAPLLDREVQVVCGGSVPDPERAFPQFAWECNGYYYFTREMQRFAERYGRGLSFANTAVRRSAWEKLHIGEQATGEDFGYQTRLHAAGAKIVFTEDAPVLHHHNYTLRGVYRRCRNEGLALREMGVPYGLGDCLADLALWKKNVQFLREIRHGRLRNAAEWAYPFLRPLAVYHGSRFARKMVWY